LLCLFFFLRVNFEGPIYLKLSVAQDRILIAESGCQREDTDMCAESARRKSHLGFVELSNNKSCSNVFCF